MFSYAQNKKKDPKPTVEKGDNLIPVTVKSTKHRKPPPPPPPILTKDGKPLPPPKVEKVRFAPPKIVKDAPKYAPKEKPVKPDAPPPADFRG